MKSSHSIGMSPQSNYPEIILKERRDRSLQRGHPWVFSGAIETAPAGLKPGTIVDLCDSSKKFLARGLWSDGSIAVKALTFRREEIDQAFWDKAIASAINVRRSLGLLDSSITNAFRLVHGEGDSLPGLIIDLYGTTAVVQLQAIALRPHLESIVTALRTALKDRLEGIIDKSLAGVNDSAESKDGGNILWGNSGSPIIKENSLNFKVDWKDGQKTGFFLDQRDNRALLQTHSKGRKVLNAFSYSGAFSLYALSGGASSVISLDASKRAIDLAEENIALNSFAGQHESVCADYFSFIKENSSIFDLIVLDPPAFAKHRDAVDEAVKGYTNINYYALKALAPGGMLMTFSCSQLVTWEAFWRAVQEGAVRAGRFVRIVGRLHQAGCHPVSIAHPEGDYLKGLFLSVE